MTRACELAARGRKRVSTAAEGRWDGDWPPSDAWPPWWSRMPSRGYAIVQLMCAMEVPFLETVRTLEKCIGGQKLDVEGSSCGLQAVAPLFEMLVPILRDGCPLDSPSGARCDAGGVWYSHPMALVRAWGGRRRSGRAVFG